MHVKLLQKKNIVEEVWLANLAMVLEVTHQKFNLLQLVFSACVAAEKYGPYYITYIIPMQAVLPKELSLFSVE